MSDLGVQSAQDGYIGWKGWNGRIPFGHCDRLGAAYFGAELHISAIKLSAQSSVLELGFGNGEFSAFCRNGGFEYVGTEIDSVLLEAARRAGLRVLAAESALRILNEEAARFDLVVAFDVFEHLDLEVLIETLCSIRTLMKPCGQLLFRIPSGDSPFARAIQHGDLTHRQSLGSSALVQLAQITGFQPKQIREPAFIYGGLGFRRFTRRLLVQCLRQMSFPVMRLTYFSGASVVLTQNLVACFRLQDTSDA